MGDGNPWQRHILDMEEAVMVGKMIHRAAAPPALLSSAGGDCGAACVAPAGVCRGGSVNEVLVPQAPRNNTTRKVPKIRMMLAKIMMLAEGL